MDRLMETNGNLIYGDIQHVFSLWALQMRIDNIIIETVSILLGRGVSSWFIRVCLQDSRVRKVQYSV